MAASGHRPALFRDAPVVILDEPSASLDPQAEADLFDLLQSLCDDRIVVFVSHRFATVRSADVVMVLTKARSWSLARTTS